LLDSSSGSDVKKENIFPLAIFLHRVLAILNSEILLPLESKTASSGKLGIAWL